MEMPSNGAGHGDSLRVVPFKSIGCDVDGKPREPSSPAIARLEVTVYVLAMERWRAG